ncbi:hypothetical protein ATO6_16450 [Oceanicola sp. 22II-s10i]|nr:hypothetical protein ATO6_16450 [Oceanicola sp. 22II-s10i]
MTVLRDPFEAVISNYFYSKKMIENGLRAPFPFESLDDYLMKNDSQVWDHLPLEMRDDPEKFIHNSCVFIGCLEDPAALEGQFQRVFDVSLELPHLNSAERTEEVSEAVRARWLRRNQEAVDLYSYVAELTRQSNSSRGTD